MTEQEIEGSLSHLTSVYFNGNRERAKEYIEWVARTHGPDFVIHCGPPGVIYGKAGELLARSAHRLAEA